MDILKDINRYCSFLKEKENWFIENYRKDEFIASSKLFVLNNSSQMLNDMIFVSKHTATNRVKLSEFIKFNKIKKFIILLNNFKAELDVNFSNVQTIIKFTTQLKENDNFLYNSLNYHNPTNIDKFLERLNMVAKDKQQILKHIEDYHKQLNKIVEKFKFKTKAL